MSSNANATQKLIKGSISYEDLDFAKNNNDQLIILGKGSFGIVYKGNYSGYTVAIKELKLQLLSSYSIHESQNKVSVKEFQKEVKAMKMAVNPNIVGFYGSSIHNNIAYMIMEYLEGGSLRSLLNKKKIDEISWPFRLRMATDVVEGLHYLHRNRILHRDIKADNVLISADGRAKLSDLGLACQSTHLNETLSNIPSNVLSAADSGQRGTWRWMAPEILEYTDKYSEKSDIYAYGVTLWEIASHAVPFPGEGVTQITVKVTRGVRPEQAIIPPEYAYYQSIIEDSWQQAPEMRPTAKDLKQRFLGFATATQQEIPSYKEIEKKLAAAITDKEQAEQETSEAKAKAEEILAAKIKAEQELTKAIAAKEQAEVDVFAMQEKAKQDVAAIIAAFKEQAAKEHAANEEIAKVKQEAKASKIEAKTNKIKAKQEAKANKIGAKQEAKAIKIQAEQEVLAAKSKAEQELADKLTQLQAEQAAALATLKLASAGTPHIAYPAPPNNQFTPGYSGQTSTTATAASTAAMPAVNQEQLQIFLRLVVEGEQDQAEAMLQQNQALALHAGDVTDLSGRSFSNITGFQYAVWALDWHMWRMILPNLPENAARAQIKAMETGLWVSAHGISASWQNLIDALGECVRLCNEKRWNDADKQWNQGVGDAQRLLPVHVINEYCHPERPFYPCPDFCESALPRSRNTNEGEWFTAEYNGSLLGMGCFGVARSVAGCAWVSAWVRVAVVGGGWQSVDHSALDTLLKTRAQQRDQLFRDIAVTPPKGFGV